MHLFTYFRCSPLGDGFFGCEHDNYVYYNDSGMLWFFLNRLRRVHVSTMPLRALGIIIGVSVLAGLITHGLLYWKAYVIAVRGFHVPWSSLVVVRDDLPLIDNTMNIVGMVVSDDTRSYTTEIEALVVIHVDFSHGSIDLVHIPRDVWVSAREDTLERAYGYGEHKQPGGGIRLVKAEVSSIIGQPVQYGVVVPYRQFALMINVLGGVSVDVPHAFTDERFPVDGKENVLCEGEVSHGCRYRVVSFDQGTERMDGDRALDYMRSTVSIERGEVLWDRNNRQQEVLSAMSEDITNRWENVELSTFIDMGRVFRTTAITDMSSRDVFMCVYRIARWDYVHISTYMLPQSLFTYVIVDEWNNKYARKSADASWDDIHTHITCLFNQGEGC